jgi:hypothetical protein
VIPDVALEILGVGRTPVAVSQHVLRLEQTGLFSKVALVDTGREAYLNGNAIAFRLQCTFGDPRQQQQSQHAHQQQVGSGPMPGFAGGAGERAAVTAAEAGGVSR